MIGIRDAEAVDFGHEDVLFVPAGMPNRFERFTDDFVTWVIFRSPDGGETFRP